MQRTFRSTGAFPPQGKDNEPRPSGPQRDTLEKGSLERAEYTAARLAEQCWMLFRIRGGYSARALQRPKTARTLYFFSTGISEVFGGGAVVVGVDSAGAGEAGIRPG